MLRFDANLTTLYSGLPVTEALAAANADGFGAVECRSPFHEPKEKVADALSALAMTMVQFNTPMGDFAAGERGIACIPGREDEVRESVELSLDYARALRVPQVNCPAGVAVPGAPREDLERLLADNLRWAADQFAQSGIRLQLEAINPVDNPGVLVATTADAMRVIDRVGHDNLFLQFDFYHAQVTQGDLIRTYESLKDRINHVQFADHPGRHEPGTGEINYRFIMERLERSGYQGWVGLEYVPAGTVKAGLGWLNAYREAG